VASAQRLTRAAEDRDRSSAGPDIHDTEKSFHFDLDI
jgi:hypothetical protein